MEASKSGHSLPIKVNSLSFAQFLLSGHLVAQEAQGGFI